MYGILLLLHILGATIWTGGHILLSTLILPKALKERSPRVLLDFEEKYERIGMPALVVQVVTGLILASRLLPSFAEWFNFTNPLSHPILAKLTLLLTTFLFALHAKFRVLPNLTPERLPVMAAHIIPVTILSILFVTVGVSFRTGWLY